MQAGVVHVQFTSIVHTQMFSSLALSRHVYRCQLLRLTVLQLYLTAAAKLQAHSMTQHDSAASAPSPLAPRTACTAATRAACFAAYGPPAHSRGLMRRVTIARLPAAAAAGQVGNPAMPAQLPRHLKSVGVWIAAIPCTGLPTLVRITSKDCSKLLL